MFKNLSLAAMAGLMATAAAAAEPVKIGFIATLSTPAGYIGEDERDAFNLAIKQGGGKLGEQPRRGGGDTQLCRMINGVCVPQ